MSLKTMCSYICIGAFAAIKFNKMFSGKQLRQGVKPLRRSRDRAFSPQLRKIFSFTRLSTREDLMCSYVYLTANGNMNPFNLRIHTIFLQNEP